MGCSCSLAWRALIPSGSLPSCKYLSASDWSAAVDKALASWPHSPWVLQRYEHPTLVHTAWADANSATAQPMSGRVRLCPYYFVTGEGDAARPHLGGVLATICPADKKIIHGLDVIFKEYREKHGIRE